MRLIGQTYFSVAILKLVGHERLTEVSRRNEAISKG